MKKESLTMALVVLMITLCFICCDKATREKINQDTNNSESSTRKDTLFTYESLLYHQGDGMYGCN